MTLITIRSLALVTFLLFSVHVFSGEKNRIQNPIYGIDISHYQGKLVNELTQAEKLNFIICKATQGVTFTDPDFLFNWRNIKRQGYIRGAYHFYMAGDTPEDQAAHFINTVKLQSRDIAPVVDIEEASLAEAYSPTSMTNDILKFLSILESHYNRTPIIYTNYLFAQQYLSDSVFGNYPLWIADYVSKDQPQIPSAWKEKGYTFWQRSESYKIDSEESDFDFFNGSINELTF